jgi:hypothetical protein
MGHDTETGDLGQWHTATPEARPRERGGDPAPGNSIVRACESPGSPG